MKTGIFLIAVIVTFAAGDTFAQSRGPSETVKSFYQFSSSRSSTFDRRHVEARKRWYTPELYQLFLEQLKKDEVELKANPTDKPFFGDGLDFQPWHEQCQAGGRSYAFSRHVGLAMVEGKVATVEVVFSYPKMCGIKASVYRVKLENNGRRWLISDWVWSEGSSLAADMKANQD
jgi:hypothetical protein